MYLKFEGVDFHVAYNASLPEQEFIDNGKRDGTFAQFAEKQEALLKDAYKAITEANATKAEAAVAEPVKATGKKATA